MWAAVKAQRGEDLRSWRQGARRSATTCVRALKAASCRCTCACRSSVASGNPFKVEFQVINIARLVGLFPEGGEVAVDRPDRQRGAVRDNAPVKVLGDGETTVAFTLKGC